MKKILFRLLPALVAFAMPFLAGAQNQHCAITVADSTGTNNYVPIYGFYCDDYLRCQMLYPASLIQEAQFMTDVTHAQYSNIIRSMTFYLAIPTTGTWGNARFVLKIKEVPTTTNVIGSAFWDMSDAVVAFSDSLVATGSTMLVHFTLGMQYTGENLLVEVDNVVKGTYESSTWYGKNYAGASLSGFSSTSVDACSASQRNFLPKTTIIFENTGLETGDGIAVTIGDEESEGTSYRCPVNNLYNYSLTETILKQDELGGGGIIRSISLKYSDNAPRMTKKSDVSIWIMPTTKNSFANNTDIETLDANAVKVYQGPLNCNAGWNEFVFMTPYEYDGTGNLMVIMDDNSGVYDGSGHQFITTSYSDYRTLVWYSDIYNPDPTSETFSGSKTYLNNRVVMRVNKDASNCGDALHCVDFHNGTTSGTGYSTGVVTSGIGTHVQTDPSSFWRRIPDLSTASLTNAAALYPRLVNTYFGGLDNFITYIQRYARPEESSAENGFMMMSLYEGVQNTGTFNAYINLGVINTVGVPVVDVTFFQYYRNYYDHCYIDWRISSTGAWNEMEINNCGANNAMNGYYTYTLPLAAAGQNYLELRIRYKSVDSQRTAYGYFWIIDDVSVTAGDADRLQFSNEEAEYVYGGYGVIPQGLQLKPAWYMPVMNNGANNQSNAEVGMVYLNGSLAGGQVLGSYNNGAVPAGETKALIFDPDGWFNTEDPDYYGWDGYATHENTHGTCAPLPTSTVGDHYLYATLGTSAIATQRLDTMHYRVSGFDNASASYLWAKDNGALCYSPYNYYALGYIRVNDNVYVTTDEEEIDFNATGYQMSLRYTTGSEVPAGWVIRGMEMVASPVPEYSGVGVRIKPVLAKNVYNESSVNFLNLLSPDVAEHVITADEINPPSVIGRDSHGYREPGQYNTIRIMFPEQPALEPYTSYQVGYEVVESSTALFLPAYAMDKYREASPTSPETMDTIIHFRNNTATRKYASIFKTNPYDVVIYDPVYLEGGVFLGVHHDNDVPMIRLLVGPAQPNGVESAGESVRLEVYPNPTDGQLTISSSETVDRIDVYSVQGRLLRSIECHDATVQLTLEGLAAGTYMLGIHTAGGVTHRRVVVK